MFYCHQSMCIPQMYRTHLQTTLQTTMSETCVMSAVPLQSTISFCLLYSFFPPVPCRVLFYPCLSLYVAGECGCPFNFCSAQFLLCMDSVMIYFHTFWLCFATFWQFPIWVSCLCLLLDLSYHAPVSFHFSAVSGSSLVSVNFLCFLVYWSIPAFPSFA